MRTTTYKRSKEYMRRMLLARLLFALALLGIGATSGVMLHVGAMNEAEAAAESEAYAEERAEPAYAILCVEPGDTLWEIAKQYGPEDAAVKAYVQELIEVNRLDSASLQVGQVLKLP